MTVKDANAAGSALVPGVHRVVRVIDADEGPFPGALVSSGDSVAVLADAAGLSGWAGWAHAGSEHVAGPVDVARRADGQDVLLPWCTERITAFLGRRTTAEAPLGPGEVSTLVASMLRGLEELDEAETEAVSGCWWLTADGRPVFAIGAGENARAGAAHIVERLRREQTDRALTRVLDAVHGGLVQGAARPRMSRLQLERWERELFEIAAPRPLRQDVHAPERVRDIDVVRAGAASAPATTRRRARAAALGDVPGARSRGIRRLGERAAATASALSAAVSAGVAERIGGMGAGRAHSARGGGDTGRGAAAPGDTGRQAAGSVSKRGRKLAIAGAVAGIVVVGGMLWPGGATGEPEQLEKAPVSKEESRAGQDGVTASPTASPSSTADEDPVAAAGVLLAVIAACAEAGDAVCAGAVASGSAGIVDALAGASTSGGELPQLTLVDAYGDVAVVRLSREPHGTGDAEPAHPHEQMIVVVRQNEQWLVRDVYGVADQPG